MPQTYFHLFDSETEHTQYINSVNYREPYVASIDNDLGVHYNEYNNDYYINTDDYIIKSYLKSPGKNTAGSLIDTGIRASNRLRIVYCGGSYQYGGDYGFPF